MHNNILNIFQLEFLLLQFVQGHFALVLYYKGLSSVHWKRLANRTKLPELEEAALHDTVHVILHRQLAGNDDSKVANGVKWRNFDALYHEIVLGNLGQPLT